LSANFGDALPSFDLGFDDSPTGAKEATPSDKIFAIQPLLLPVGCASSNPTSSKSSCQLFEILGFDASRHEAQCIILDIVHVTEESIDPTGKVLYGQWITRPFKENVVPAGPLQYVPWSLELRHRKHEPDIIHALIDCCNELSESAVRREWLVHSLPRYLVLIGSEIISSFVEGKDVDSYIIDTVFRRYRQIDVTHLCS